jgi:hypothetical protein
MPARRRERPALTTAELNNRHRVMRRQESERRMGVSWTTIQRLYGHLLVRPSPGTVGMMVGTADDILAGRIR